MFQKKKKTLYKKYLEKKKASEEIQNIKENLQEEPDVKPRQLIINRITLSAKLTQYLSDSLQVIGKIIFWVAISGAVSLIITLLLNKATREQFINLIMQLFKSIGF